MSETRTARIILWSLVGLGAVLRVAAYLHNRSLSNDEARVAHDLIARSYSHATLHTPPLFKWSTQFVTDRLGTSEFALRLLPLVFGVASLGLFAALTVWFLEPRARVIALLLFAVADRLIYFSTELKPYAGDVAIALVLLIMATRMLRNPPGSAGALAYGLAGALVVWWSLPSVFVLAGIATTLILGADVDRDTPRVMRTAAIAMMWAASFGALYFLTQLRRSSVDPGLRESWRPGFMPLPPHTVADLQWYPVAFIKLFVDPGAFVLPGIAALAFLVGCALMWQQRRASGLLLLSPFPFVLAASALARYPFADRLMLFMLPVCLMFIAAGTDWVMRQRLMIAIPFVLMLCAPPVVMGLYHLKKPVAIEEIKPVLGHIRDGWRSGDRLYVYNGAQPAFEYYAAAYGFRGEDTVQGIQAREHWQQYFDDADRLRGKGRVWILFSHVFTWGSASEETVILFRLDQIGKRLDRFSQPDASAYLYDLE